VQPAPRQEEQYKLIPPPSSPPLGRGQLPIAAEEKSQTQKARRMNILPGFSFETYAWGGNWHRTGSDAHPLACRE